MHILWDYIKVLKMQSLGCPVRSELRQTTDNIYITFQKQWMTHCRGGTEANMITNKVPQTLYFLNERLWNVKEGTDHSNKTPGYAYYW